jgi:hypothetical protein
MGQVHIVHHRCACVCSWVVLMFDKILYLKKEGFSLRKIITFLFFYQIEWFKWQEVRN